MRNFRSSFFDTDGAGQEFLDDDATDTVVERLADRGITEESVGKEDYAYEFDKELEQYMKQAEDDYGDYLADREEAAREEREYWDNRPGGYADYIY